MFSGRDLGKFPGPKSRPRAQLFQKCQLYNVFSAPVINADQNAGSVTYTSGSESVTFVRVDSKILSSDLSDECSKIDPSYSTLTMASELQYEVYFSLNTDFLR